MEPLVASQIAQFSRLSRARLLSAAAMPRGSENYVREETLVHFIRVANRESDSRATSDLIRILIKRISGKLNRLTQVWRLSYPPDLAEDVIDEILTDLYDQLLSDEPAARFWQIRFWVCFQRRAINVLRHRRRELDQIVADEGDDWDADCEPCAAKPYERIERLDEPEMHAVVNDGLVKLPLPLRTAFLLKHYSGYAEEPGVDGTPSIASLMGVSGRTVRNYLARAAKHLAQWREEEDTDG